MPSSFRTESLHLPTSSSDMAVFHAHPAAPNGRGLVLFQEAFGVNEHIRELALRFAEQGYDVLAPELYHRTAPCFTGSYADFSSALPHMQALTHEGLSEDIAACYDTLVQNCDRVVCSGYCLGGRVAFLAASLRPFRAAASYYGGNIPSLLDCAQHLQAPVLFFWGDQDSHIPVAQRVQVLDALRAAGKSFTDVTFSDAGHAFFNDARPSYHPASAQQAWAHTLAFFDWHCSH